MKWLATVIHDTTYYSFLAPKIYHTIDATLIIISAAFMWTHKRQTVWELNYKSINVVKSILFNFTEIN